MQAPWCRHLSASCTHYIGFMHDSSLNDAHTHTLSVSCTPPGRLLHAPYPLDGSRGTYKFSAFHTSPAAPSPQRLMKSQPPSDRGRGCAGTRISAGDAARGEGVRLGPREGEEEEEVGDRLVRGDGPGPRMLACCRGSTSCNAQGTQGEAGANAPLELALPHAGTWRHEGSASRWGTENEGQGAVSAECRTSSTTRGPMR